LPVGSARVRYCGEPQSGTVAGKFSADRYPGLPRWGAKSSAAVLAKFRHVESIPADPRQWGVSVTGAPTLAATLSEQREKAILFRTLATLRTDIPLFKNVDELRWNGPKPEFDAWSKRLDAAKTDRLSGGTNEIPKSNRRR
jgi:5'-3' exonuclease